MIKNISRFMMIMLSALLGSIQPQAMNKENIQRKPDGIRKLCLAARHGYIDIVKNLVPQSNININTQDKHGSTALNMAILGLGVARDSDKNSDNYMQIIRLLLNHKADPNLNEGSHNNVPMERTPLYLAAVFFKEPDVVTLLLNHGADHTQRTYDGSQTLLQYIEKNPNENSQFSSRKYYQTNHTIIVEILKNHERKNNTALDNQNSIAAKIIHKKKNPTTTIEHKQLPDKHHMLPPNLGKNNNIPKHNFSINPIGTSLIIAATVGIYLIYKKYWKKSENEKQEPVARKRTA